jgi:hypothetical protein
MTLTAPHTRRPWRTGGAERAAVSWTHHPLRAAGTGLLIVLLAAWAGVAVFIGPSFGYRPTSAASWQWTTTNWLLHLLPGAAGVLGGLLILGRAPTLRARGAVWFGVLLVVAAGAWLVIGPVTWPLFESGPPFIQASPWRDFLNQVGANLGPGVLLAVFGGVALKAGAATKLVPTSATPVESTAPTSPVASEPPGVVERSPVADP